MRTELNGTRLSSSTRGIGRRRYAHSESVRLDLQLVPREVEDELGNQRAHLDVRDHHPAFGKNQPDRQANPA
jgi:hypothetical protein